MFRRGGQATGGITTGLGRQGYANGDLAKVQSQLDLINRLSPQRSGSNLNDFMINFGLNMVGNPPSGNIFQTAAKQAQEPFGQFQQAGAKDINDWMIQQIKDQGENWTSWFIDTVISQENY